jgi:glycosyltransferase involved in cell wall biosynthesis
VNVPRRRGLSGRPVERARPRRPAHEVLLEQTIALERRGPLIHTCTLAAPPAPPRLLNIPGRPRVGFLCAWGALSGATALLVGAACRFDVERWDRVFLAGEPDRLHPPYRARLAAAAVPIDAATEGNIRACDLVFAWGWHVRPNRLGWPPLILIAHTASTESSHWYAPCAKIAVGAVGASADAARFVEALFGWSPGHVSVAWTFAMTGGDEAILPVRTRPARCARDAPLVLGFLGRLSVEKNLIRLLEALTRLPANVTLRIYGEGGCEAALRSATAVWQLGDRVTFCGRTDDPERVYNEFDALVIPSLFEGLPVVLVEAFRALCPVITTRYGDIELIARDGVRGVLAESSQTAHLVEAIERFRTDLTLGRRLPFAARRFALQHLTERGMAAHYEALAAAALVKDRPTL